MLTQLSTLKLRLGLDPIDLADDTLLTNLIKHVTGRFVAETNRCFAYAADHEFQFRADCLNLIVDRYPIVSVSSLWLKPSEREGWTEVTDIDYLISPTKTSIELEINLGSSREVGKVIYSGGYTLPGDTAADGATALPDLIEQAACDQIAYWYQRRNQLGLTSLTTQGGSISQPSAQDLLPHVQAVIKQYERYLN